ncbi:MAG: polyprenyl synthetase family protein [Candidatus Fimimonas sp.]
MSKNKIPVEKIDELLRKYLPQKNDKVVQAMEYSLFSGGKRFRPLLLLNTALAVGKKVNENAERLAVALEYVHTYSLIHDDLPAMDNDELRRGRRTCHLQFGEAAAILAGDALLNTAMEVVLEGNLSNKHYQQAVSYLFAKSGVNGMLYGQSLDLFSQTQCFDEANEVALHKTGDLLRAAIVCGALCGRATEEEVETFDLIGSAFGIAYQVVDDLLDAQKCEKSFLDVMSERECREYARKLTEKLVELCNSMPQYDLSFIVDCAMKNLSRNR